MLSKKHILIVDDEVRGSLTLALAFTSQGYDARAAHSAQQVMRMIRDWPPHVCLVDVNLSDTSGIDFAMRLRKLFPFAKIVLYTGFNDLSDQFDATKEAKPSDFEVVRKPIHPKRILRLISNWLSDVEVAETEEGIAIHNCRAV